MLGGVGDEDGSRRTLDVIRANSIRLAGAWSGPPADRVVLAYDDRHRRRFAMQAEGGLMFLLDLREATVLRQGDGLLLEDGRIVEVRAKPEPLLEVRARDPHHLARLAWHLGNRHLPAAIEPDRLLIRPDHVIAAMLAGLGAEVAAVEAPFDPEGGAYAQGGRASSAHHEHGAGPHYHHHGHG
jgi:urease accessory protein